MENEMIAVLGIGGYFADNRKYIDPDIHFSYYLDNDPGKWETYPFDDGIKCISPESLTVKPDLIVIGVDRGKMRHCLLQQGNRLGKRCITIDELRNDYVDAWEENRKKKSKEEVERLFSGTKKGHRIILLNSPQISSTIGDHSIAVAEVCFLKERFPERELIEVGDVFFWEHKRELAEEIMPSDVLLIQGGGYLGSLWKIRREYSVRYILQTFTENRIVILPQTMYFEDNEEGRKEQAVSELVYNSHQRLTMCFREKISYRLSDSILNANKIRYLIPDSVLSLRFTGEKRRRRGISICFKNDKETLSSVEEQEHLTSKLINAGYEVTKTSMFYSAQIISAVDREQAVRNKMQELAGYELVITDAMHGMVLSAVCGTKCVGVETITRKVGGVYEWLERLKYVEYASKINEVYKKAMNLLEIDEEYSYENEIAYLNEKFDLLEKIIAGKEE